MDGCVLPGKECALGHKSVYEKFNWNLWNVGYKIRYVFGCSKTSPGMDTLKVKKKKKVLHPIKEDALEAKK